MAFHFDLDAESKTVIEEILNYKWLQSEKEGADIGLTRAAQEWIENYYDSWFAQNAQNFFSEK